MDDVSRADPKFYLPARVVQAGNPLLSFQTVNFPISGFLTFFPYISGIFLEIFQEKCLFFIFQFSVRNFPLFSQGIRIPSPVLCALQRGA